MKREDDEYASIVLDALKRAVAEELERKRRLGHYYVVWRDGRAVCIGPDAPVASEEKQDLLHPERSTMMGLTQSEREQILVIARRHGVTNVRVFGSMARGDAGPDIDVDLLVEVGESTSAWFPGGLVADLEELLGRRVQVVTLGGLDELLRDRVLNEAVSL